jgi:2-dehydropantoate 2-reductase
MSRLSILVVGAGSTGGYFGMRLAQANRDVTFLVRPRRAGVLRERGLRLIEGNREERIEPRVTTARELDRPFDIVLLSVKAMALRRALDDLAPAVVEHTRIIPFLNGMAHLDELNRRFGESVTLTGVVVVPIELNAAGDVVKLAPAATMEIGQQDGAVSPRLRAIADELTVPGFDLRLSAHGVAGMWHKWVFLSTMAALTCLMRGNVGDIVACPGGAELGPAILAEAAAVSAAAGYPVPAEAVAQTTATVTAAGSPLTASLYRDVSVGNRTEVEQVLGDLVYRAGMLGVATPLLDLATLHLRVYEHRLEART